MENSTQNNSEESVDPLELNAGKFFFIFECCLLKSVQKVGIEKEGRIFFRETSN